jgi:hypothetical protein
LEQGEAGQRGQLAAEPLGEAECLEGPVGWVRESAGEQPNPTSAILYENALADVISPIAAKNSLGPDNCAS